VPFTSYLRKRDLKKRYISGKRPIRQTNKKETVLFIFERNRAKSSALKELCPSRVVSGKEILKRDT